MDTKVFALIELTFCAESFQTKGKPVACFVQSRVSKFLKVCKKPKIFTNTLQKSLLSTLKLMDNNLETYPYY
jgi:hypothetical protein